MSIDISQWARCQHQDIVSYFLGVAADPEKYQTDPFEELSTLGLLIIYDSSPGLSQALIEADYLTHSILHARVKLPSLRPSTQLVRIAFRDLIGSWHFMLERSESQSIYLELSKKMLDLDVLFIVEAFVVIKLDAGSTLGKLFC
ncbi:hypothetical protein DL93DRAFT_1386883 [Clavulina sp. PMI_390]|nr:hypothetical protein DL93DRAFT_1386883 [Clavulina sp. PMI_390]